MASEQQHLKTELADCRNSPATTNEANRRLQETMRNAREGKTVEAFNGSLTVMQSMFAAMLKGNAANADALAIAQAACVEKDSKIAELEAKMEGMISQKDALELHWECTTECTAEIKGLKLELSVAKASSKSLETSRSTDEATHSLVCSRKNERIRQLEGTSRHLKDQLESALAAEVASIKGVERIQKEKAESLKVLIGRLEAKDAEVRDANVQMEVIAEKNSMIKAKDKELTSTRNRIIALESEMRKKDAKLAKAKARKRKPVLTVIFTQAGFPTRAYAVFQPQQLALILDIYAGHSGSDVKNMMLKENHPDGGGYMVDPKEELLEPDTDVDQDIDFRAYEIIKVAPSTTKRKTLEGGLDGSSKKQRV
ncbi:hypothetical protein LTR56_012781 [Elasticomyces elasticus]|nr:hypothetical protein LTR56_012781 [Elasticomyces elasticus]KAK3647176.1 hypothetical protein LTR22_013969 [Elasticomyces elasticus]KAK4918612.1 hypothetical protein LTR49_013682 [Elasticomyces elasticus]KAK5756132.1 hypothetical protein LTS12_013815 [Elasticomyces elasticus]